MLQTVREQRGLGVEIVAEATGISAARLTQFESGERKPSRIQIEKLAESLAVPAHSLFGESVPELLPLPTDFRKPNPNPAIVSPKGLRSYAASVALSSFTKQIADALSFKFPSLSITNEVDPAKRAARYKQEFETWLEPRVDQFGFTGSPEQKMFGALRLFFEVHGGVVNVNTAPSDDYFGFFANSSSIMPTIFVNRVVLSRKAQLFTFVHEMSHAILNQTGISNPFVAQNKVERECNIFAAEFLAPMDQFSRMVGQLPREFRADTADFVKAVSARTMLSNHAAAIRLVEGNFITRSQFANWRSQVTVSYKGEKDEEKELEQSAGGVPHAKRLSEVGHLAIFLADKAVRGKLIDPIDVVSGIGLSLKLQARAFDLAVRRVEAAF